MNLNIILEEQYVKPKHIAFIASIMGAYHNKLEREKLEIIQNTNKLNEWFGAIKTRIDHQVKIIAISSYGTEWGTGYRISMIDEAGRTFIWFASNIPHDDNGNQELLEDQSYIIKMTIKDHSEYKNRKQTVVNRCKIVKQVS